MHGCENEDNHRCETPNDLIQLLKRYPTRSAFFFIGVKARSTFEVHSSVDKGEHEFRLGANAKVKLIALLSPSSSNKMPLDEKAEKWPNALSSFLAL